MTESAATSDSSTAPPPGYNAPVYVRAPGRAAQRECGTGWRRASTAGLQVIGSQISPQRGHSGMASARAEAEHARQGHSHCFKDGDTGKEKEGRGCWEKATSGPWVHKCLRYTSAQQYQTGRRAVPPRQTFSERRLLYSKSVFTY